MSTSITDNRSKSKPLSTSSPNKVAKLLLRKIVPGVLSEKGRAKVVLANGESYSIDVSRIKSISYIPNRGYVVDYETEHPEFYEEKKSIVDPNDPMLKLAIPLKFKIKKSIENVYFCPICGRELEAEEDVDDIAYKCRVHGFEWEWGRYVSGRYWSEPISDYEWEYEDYVPDDDEYKDSPKPVAKQVERLRLEIELPNIADIENLIVKFADIEAKWIKYIPRELIRAEYSEGSKKFMISKYDFDLMLKSDYIYELVVKEINNEKYIVVEIEREDTLSVERAALKIRVRDHELFNLLFGKKEEAKQKIEKPRPAEAVKQQEKIEKKIEEPKEPEISFEEAVKIAREKIPDWADGIVILSRNACVGCYIILPAKKSKKPGSLFYTSRRWKDVYLGEHRDKIIKHLMNKLITRDDIYEIEPVDSSFEIKDYYDLKLKNIDNISKKIEKLEDLVSEIDRILPEWSKGIYISRENDRYVVRMVAEYPSRDYDYYYKENWVVNLDAPEDLLRQLDGRVVLRSGKVVEVEKAGKRPSDKIKLNIKEG
jgi:hypothetical protein